MYECVPGSLASNLASVLDCEWTVAGGCKSDGDGGCCVLPARLPSDVRVCPLPGAPHCLFSRKWHSLCPHCSVPGRSPACCPPDARVMLTCKSLTSPALYSSPLRSSASFQASRACVCRPQLGSESAIARGQCPPIFPHSRDLSLVPPDGMPTVLPSPFSRRLNFIVTILSLRLSNLAMRRSAPNPARKKALEPLPLLSSSRIKAAPTAPTTASTTHTRSSASSCLALRRSLQPLRPSLQSSSLLYPP